MFFFLLRRAKLRLKASNSIWRYVKDRNLNTTGLLRLHTRCTLAFSYIRFTKKARNDAIDVLSEKRVWTKFIATRFLRWLNYKQCGKSRFLASGFGAIPGIGKRECVSSSRVRVSSQIGENKKISGNSWSTQYWRRETAAASCSLTRPRTFWPLLTRHRGIYSREKGRVGESRVT